MYKFRECRGEEKKMEVEEKDRAKYAPLWLLGRMVPFSNLNNFPGQSAEIGGAEFNMLRILAF